METNLLLRDGKPKKIINYKEGNLMELTLPIIHDSILKMSKFFKNGIIDGDDFIIMKMVKNGF
jgi:antitoxin component YwqK of YwqJK toxin-antitoxin module